LRVLAVNATESGDSKVSTCALLGRRLSVEAGAQADRSTCPTCSDSAVRTERVCSDACYARNWRGAGRVVVSRTRHCRLSRLPWTQ
jgi:hypothetical protein